MGGGGNQKWSGYIEPAKLIPVGEQPKKKESKQKYEWESLPIGNRRKKSKKEKEIDVWKKSRTQSPEAAAERERRAKLKAMSSEQRINFLAEKKMWDRHLKKEYGKWQRGGERGGHEKGWVKGKLSELKKQWANGGVKKWVNSNQRQAASIINKAIREEAWRNK